MGDFNVQALANTAWGVATACQTDAQLFMALARTAERCVGDCNVHDLANTAWAFATAGQSDVQLFAALARAVEQRVSDFNMQNDISSCYPVFHTLL